MIKIGNEEFSHLNKQIKHQQPNQIIKQKYPPIEKPPSNQVTESITSNLTSNVSKPPLGRTPQTLPVKKRKKFHQARTADKNTKPVVAGKK